MPHRPPRFPVIDGFEFAAAGRSMRGAWPVETFPRLRGLLHDNAGAVECELRGVRDAHGRSRLELQLWATLALTCRNCLGAVAVEVREKATLWLARSQAEIDAQQLAAEGPDSIVGSKDMVVRDLVEDELLLALPYSPRHESCPAQGGASPAEQRKPFAGLRGLMRGRIRH